MKNVILNATLIMATSLLATMANADQILSLSKTEVKALNAALSAPSSVGTLLKCDSKILLQMSNGARIKGGNYSGSMYGIQYQFEFVNRGGRTETLVVRESYRDSNGAYLIPSTVECGIAN